MVMSAILVVRIFQLQIIHGEEYEQSFHETTTKTRKLTSTRGNIYDVNGKLLAYNKLANAVMFEDNGSYDTKRERNLNLNSQLYYLTSLITECGDKLQTDFHIIIDENGNYTFDVEEGTARNRFRADIYGYKTIEEMSADEASSTPDDIMELLCGAERFALVNEERPYTEEELARYHLPLSFTKEEALNIVRIRYKLLLTSYQKYLQVTVASDVSDKTVAAVKENAEKLPGADIQEESIRVYNYAECMAPIIGYTGRPSTEELEELLQQRPDYTSSSIIGKTGIENYMETTLQGVEGSEKVAVDNLGTELFVYEDSIVEPQQGDDVYLTIDVELQEACYKILEQRIAGILVSNIADLKTVDRNPDDEDEGANIPIPVYDVYHALINNNIIDIDRFRMAEATDLERDIQQRFDRRVSQILSDLSAELLGQSDTVYEKLTTEYQDYVAYLVNDFLTEETMILKPEGEYEEEEIYQAWTEGTVSVHDWISYAVEQSWIDLSTLFDDSEYMNSEEILETLASYLSDALKEDKGFAKIVYKYMLLNDEIYPYEIMNLLYDQGKLEKDDLYNQFVSGEISPLQLVMELIRTLRIKPKQLALDPCSGSIVVTDPDSGRVRALVTYPGYDNNRLANDMDVAYYNELYEDLSTPFYNKATQQLTAPGSTFKPVMVAAGLNEHVIDDSTMINCDGLFGEGLVDKSDQIHCMVRQGHGDLNVVSALQNSCNVFFCTVGYRLGLIGSTGFSSATALDKIRQYANLFNLDTKTNIQMTESEPRVSDSMAIPSSIGQGTHLYTTTQLARYAAFLQNRGTSYDLTLLDKVTDSYGSVLNTFEPTVAKQTSFGEGIWNDIHTGMRRVAENNSAFSDCPVELYGKTGTAEESKLRADHALFIGFSHYETQEDIAFAIRVAYGYSSMNTSMIARDMIDYYYNLEDEATLLNGVAAVDGITSIVTD